MRKNFQKLSSYIISFLVGYIILSIADREKGWDVLEVLLRAIIASIAIIGGEYMLKKHPNYGEE